MILRFVIAVPTYNNTPELASVIRGCLRDTSFPIVVVDDGSEPRAETVLAGEPFVDAIRAERLILLRHERNRGKGKALQTAMAEAVRRGFTHLVAMDGDGQHLSTEIGKLVSTAEEHPWDLVIGCRELSKPSVPGISRFGRRFSNFWVRYETDLRIRDSQSGFRIYPLFFVQTERFLTGRYDFEIEILIRLLWKGVHLREIDVDVAYPPAKERISHFHQFWDNARISLLNTFLVALSLLKTHRSARDIAIALGLGVWIGCTPFFGFHWLIALAVALILRLNAIVLLLGTQVSNPLLAPLIVGLSAKLGEILIQRPLNTVSGFSMDWFVGSLLVGGCLGTVTGGIAYGMARRFRTRFVSRAWTGRPRGGRFGNGFMRIVGRYLGLGTAYGFLHFIIPYFYFFAPAARRASNEYWRVVRPNLGWWRRQRNVLKHLFVFGQILVDRMVQSFYPTSCFQSRPHGLEEIARPIRDGKGLVLLSAHCGGWDIAAAALSMDGVAERFHMVQFREEGENSGNPVEPMEASSVRRLWIHQVQQPILTIRELLADGEPVGMMADRPVGKHFELVPFLGKLAPFDGTPFRIAASCQVPLLFTVAFKGEGRAYDFFATPSKLYRYDPSLSPETQRYEWMREFVTYLEGMLKRYPYQWTNFFPFWSSLPKPVETPFAEPDAKSDKRLRPEEHTPPPPEPASDAGTRASAG